MSRLLIEKILLRNIRCYEHLEIEFKKGTNVITGQNGAGKSTILLSIGFALFGTKYLTESSIDQYQMVTWGEVEGEIQLTFSYNDKKYLSKYIISHKTGKTSWRVRDETLRRYVTKNITESREYIQKILEQMVDATIFKNALCAAQGELSVLLDADRKVRIEQLNKILGLSNYDTAYYNLNKLHKMLVNKQEETTVKLNLLQRDFVDPLVIKEQIEEKKSEYDTILVKIEELSISSSDLKKKIEYMDKERMELVRLTNLLETTSQQFSKNQQDQREINEKLHLAFKDMNKEKESHKGSRKLATKLESDLDTIREELDEIKLKINNFNSLYSQLQQVKKENEKEIQYHDQLKVKLENIMLDEDLISKISKLEESIHQDELKLNTIKNQIETNIVKIKNTESNRLNKNNEISAQSSILKKEFGLEFHELQNQIVEIERKISNKMDVENEKEQLINDLHTNIGRLNARIELSLGTIQLLEKADESSICPTCLRKFEENNQCNLVTKHTALISEFRSELANLRNKKHGLDEDLNQLKSELNTMNKQLQQMNYYIQQIPEREKKFEEIRLLDQELIKLHTEETQLMDELDKSNQGLLPLKKDELKKLKEEHKQLTSLREQIKISEGKISNNSSRIKNLIVQTKDVDIEISTELKNQLEERNLTIGSQLSILNKKILPFYDNLSNLIDENIRLGEEISSIQINMQSKQGKIDEEELFKLKEKSNENAIQLGSLNEKASNIRNNEIPELEKQLEKCQETLDLINEMRDSNTQLMSVIPISGKVKDLIAQLPTNIMAKITEVVSLHITSIMKRLLPNRGFDKIIFSEEGELEVYNKGQLINRNSISGGEKTVLGVALRIALAEFVAPMKLLILDEPTNHLDSNRINEFIEIVDRDELFNFDAGQLIIVTHRDEFNRNASRTIKLEINKDNRRDIIINQS
ncbi:MAG: AAA family ATPase [Candidatus Heimdallarchaeota archaeon]|nr:AAA family ATPase [Candidatus Heimdallarchaeota archaeon]